MKIALAQLNQIVGDIKGNTDRIISVIKKIKADIIVFPELSITGYSPQDLLHNPNFIDENMNALKEVVLSTKNKASIVGFVENGLRKKSLFFIERERASELVRNSMKRERAIARNSKRFFQKTNLYNSAAIIKDKNIVNIHRKICLPNYTIFDEKRWFKEGDIATIFELNGKKIGVSICEDIWFPGTTIQQKEKGAELIINISASPYRKGKIEAIESVLKQRWEENRLPMIYVNQVGAQDGIVYYGHSMYYTNGRVIEKCKDFEEDLIIVDVD